MFKSRQLFGLRMHLIPSFGPMMTDNELIEQCLVPRKKLSASQAHRQINDRHEVVFDSGLEQQVQTVEICVVLLLLLLLLRDYA